MIAAAADYAPRASDAATQGAHDTTVALHDPNRLTEQFRSDWRDLARHSAVANPFFSQRFLDAALHQLSRGDSIRLLTFRANEDDALIFLAPIIKQCGYAKLPLCYYAIWTHAHCFNGTPLVRKNEEQLALTALARWIDTEPDGALFFRMPCFIDEASLAHWTAPSSSIAARMKVQRCHQRAAVGANADINAHLTSALSGKKQKELRRQFRRLGDHGAVSFQTRSVDAATLRAFERLENAGWKAEAAEGRPLAGSATDHAFFVEACLGDPNAMCLALNVDQRPIAMLIILKSGDRLSASRRFDQQMNAGRVGAPGGVMGDLE
ncbi:MAG: GNAT family N-acetyltransferase, partial [Pseudomonadota bacterium]